MIALKSRLLSSISGIDHGFGTAAEAVPASFAAGWEAARPRLKQIHGVAIAEARAPAQECGQVDSLFTRAPGVPIGVQTADCVPIVLARRDGKAVAAVHAGWRGTRAHALPELFKWLGAHGEKPGDWLAAIGPAIGPCCYEVSEEIAEDFAREFAAFGDRLAVPERRRLDLTAIHEAELKRLGIGDIELIRACTRCTTDGDSTHAFRSYRREGGGTRQWSVARIRA